MLHMQIKEIKDNQWLGGPDNPVKPCKFQAGQLTMEFVEGRILNICTGGQKLIDEVYFALRDYNWGTVPYRIEGLQFEEKTDSFRISFQAVHDSGDIRFEWKGVITGTSESSIEYSFYGQAQSDFLRNRIGLCVLHPASCGGMACEVEHFSSDSETGTLPEMISPHQPFVDIKSITHYPAKGMAVKVSFQGEIFEMEDQRNWTDASFKTYGTPLSIPFPVQVHKGECVRQTVGIRLMADENGSHGDAPQQEETVISAEDFLTLDKQFSLGSCITRPLTKLQMQRTAALGLSHLRLDYHFGEADDKQAGEIFRQAEAMHVKILLALFFTEQWESQMKSLEPLIEGREKQILGILIFQDYAAVISPERLEAIRSFLSRWKIPVGSGTDAFFTQINRRRPAREIMDFVSYSNNPQVHAFDNESIMSTTEGQQMNLKSCAGLYPGLPVWVSPVTLKMRWNPDATGKKLLQKGETPQDVDIRQMSLFAASWFLRSAAACMAGGAAGMTYFELVGSKGIMEESVPDRDYAFPAAPDMLYPLYFAFFGLRNLSSYRAGVLLRETVTAIYLKGEQKSRLILSNPKGSQVTVMVNLFRDTPAGFILDQENAAQMAQKEYISVSDGIWRRLDLTKPVVLKPYALMVLEFQTDID